MMRARIVIIAKAPIGGFAKTRLIPALGPDGAARLARRMLEHTAHTALLADVGPIELCVTPSPADLVWTTLDLPGRLKWSKQGDGDLGMRMARAASRATDAGEKVILIGTDCPDLTAQHLRDAAAALADHDAAIVPTVDGGYALLALRRFHPCLFEHMPWSTDGVACETLRRIGRLGWRASSARALHDIDEPADLAWLPADWQDALGPARSTTPDTPPTSEQPHR